MLCECIFILLCFFSVEHPEVSFENNRYFFSHSEEGCNESVSAVGKNCFSKCVFYFYKILHLLGHLSSFYKFPEDIKAGFVPEEEG